MEAVVQVVGQSDGVRQVHLIGGETLLISAQEWTTKMHEQSSDRAASAKPKSPWQSACPSRNSFSESDQWIPYGPVSLDLSARRMRSATFTKDRRRGDAAPPVSSVMAIQKSARFRVAIRARRPCH